jgi:hypothetical protein
MRVRCGYWGNVLLHISSGTVIVNTVFASSGCSFVGSRLAESRVIILKRSASWPWDN